MNPRRITLALGASAGGLLAALVGAGVATADTFDYVVEPGTQQMLPPTGTPPMDIGTQSYDVFNVDDTTVGTSTNPDVVGQFGGFLTTLTNADGTGNVLLRVAEAFPGSNTDVPALGSVIDDDNFGGGFVNIYSDLVGAGANGTNLITDTFDTPFGDYTIPTDFDAAAIIDAFPTITP